MSPPRKRSGMWPQSWARSSRPRRRCTSSGPCSPGMSRLRRPSARPIQRSSSSQRRCRCRPPNWSSRYSGCTSLRGKRSGRGRLSLARSIPHRRRGKRSGRSMAGTSRWSRGPGCPLPTLPPSTQHLQPGTRTARWMAGRYPESTLSARSQRWRRRSNQYWHLYTKSVQWMAGTSRWSRGSGCWLQ